MDAGFVHGLLETARAEAFMQGLRAGRLGHSSMTPEQEAMARSIIMRLALLESDSEHWWHPLLVPDEVDGEQLVEDARAWLKADQGAEGN